jgi:hypothetical protein
VLGSTRDGRLNRQSRAVKDRLSWAVNAMVGGKRLDVPASKSCSGTCSDYSVLYNVKTEIERKDGIVNSLEPPPTISEAGQEQKEYQF